MKTLATLAAMLVLGMGTALAQGGPDGRAGGGPAGGGGPGMEGPGMGGGAPEGAGEPAAKGGGPAEGLGDAPAARENRRESATDAGRGRADSDRPQRARKAAEDAPTKAEGNAKKAERATSDQKRATSDDKRAKSDDKADDAQARTKEEGKEATEQTKESVSKPDTDSARADKPESAKKVDLSPDKRDRVQTALSGKSDVKHRTDVHIDISLGRRLPRDWDFAPLPIAVIEIVPEYRDYVFVWVEDEYVICDPVTYEVVAVIPASSRRHAAAGSGGGGRCSTGITLSDDERELILRSVRIGHEVDVADLQVGWSVPGDIELEPFPEAVLSEADELSGCRYFIADDQLAIVDPDEDKVVLLIDKG